MADAGVKVAYNSDMQLAVLAALGLDKNDRVTCIVMTPGNIIVDTLDSDENGKLSATFSRGPDGERQVFRNKTVYSTHVKEQVE